MRKLLAIGLVLAILIPSVFSAFETKASRNAIWADFYVCCDQITIYGLIRTNTVVMCIPSGNRDCGPEMPCYGILALCDFE